MPLLEGRGAGAQGLRQMRWAKLTAWPGLRRMPCVPADKAVCSGWVTTPPVVLISPA